jgi:seryl-tRNA synthetase
MLDTKFIRENKEIVKEGVSKKGEETSKVDDALALDERRRHALQHVEQLKH